MIKLVCIVEVAEADTVAEAQAKLDAFREAVLPNEHGLSLYRASEAVADAAYYYEPGGDQDEEAGEVTHNPTRHVINMDDENQPRHELRLFCFECGEAMFITETGVSHHATEDGEIDHDADADHVATRDTTP